MAEALGRTLVPKCEPMEKAAMQVIALRTLKQFWRLHPKAQAPLRVWYAIAAHANWSAPQDVKTNFGATVYFVADTLAIFDIGGDKYRLIVHVAYRYKRVFIKFIGTLREFGRIDPESIA
jgi:mRNA interferase HigB